MRRLYYVGLTLALAAVIHVDWHLARPAHHRLSLGWAQHWIFPAIAFALVGCLIARSSPRPPWRAAAATVGVAVLLAQVLEPVMEMILYQGELGYPSDPGRWTAFFVCMAAGLPAMIATLVLCRPRARARDMVAPSA
jgi:FtsH-binding integral membrane protein